MDVKRVSDVLSIYISISLVVSWQYCCHYSGCFFFKLPFAPLRMCLGYFLVYIEICTIGYWAITATHIDTFLAYKMSGSTMGTLGRHKRCRRNIVKHECNNPDGPGNSLLEGSLEPGHSTEIQRTNISSPTVEQQEQPTTELPTATLPSPMMPSILSPKNDGAQTSILKSTSTDPPWKSAASITPLSSMHEKVVADFTTEELSTFLAFLWQEKTAAHCGQGTHPPNSAVDTITTGTITTDSTDDAATNSTVRSLPLHCNNRYIDFEKLSDFDLDFGSFSNKINEFGTKTERESCEATRKAESRATKTIVAAIMAAGDDNQQRALALHRSFLDAWENKKNS